MFENAELGHATPKDVYKQEAAELRAALLEAQRQLADAPFSVLLVVAGSPAAGKSEAVNLLLDWMDARGIETHAFARPTGEEKRHPPLWRVWRRLPARGRTGIFFGGWELDPVVRYAFGKLDRGRFDAAITRYCEFERMLTLEGTLLVKVWLHLSRPAMKARLREQRDDPAQAWRVTKLDRRILKRYDDFLSASELLLRRSSTGEAPWTVVEATDWRYRNLTVARTLLTALQERLARAGQALPRPAPQPVRLTPDPVNVISRLDLTRTLDEKTYAKELAAAEAELGPLTRKLRKKKRSAILVFEGTDAAGKGGAIRRLTHAMDARDYRVISVSAPTDEERAHPYLWRFWRQVPPRGRVTIYDRSWYGRVLVERVEGFAAPDEWGRAYEEINEFEAQLADFGVVVIKFWLAISPQEQLERFRDRQLTPYKQHKLTAEDWRNRERWDSYVAAASEMVERTSTERAPWVLVEAENKEHARVKVMRTVVDRLRAACGG